MSQSTTTAATVYVGLDVHKDRIDIALAEAAVTAKYAIWADPCSEANDCGHSLTIVKLFVLRDLPGSSRKGKNRGALFLKRREGGTSFFSIACYVQGPDLP
jgi:hypothetical protein